MVHKASLTHDEVPEGGLLNIPDDGGYGMPTVQDQQYSEWSSKIVHICVPLFWNEVKYE